MMIANNCITPNKIILDPLLVKRGEFYARQNITIKIKFSIGTDNFDPLKVTRFKTITASKID